MVSNLVFVCGGFVPLFSLFLGWLLLWLSGVIDFLGRSFCSCDIKFS